MLVQQRLSPLRLQPARLVAARAAVLARISVRRLARPDAVRRFILAAVIAERLAATAPLRPEPAEHGEPARRVFAGGHRHLTFRELGRPHRFGLFRRSLVGHGCAHHGWRHHSEHEHGHWSDEGRSHWNPSNWHRSHGHPSHWHRSHGHGEH
ncbi:MAG: hypothetical protein JO222_11755 [Frankiales bacterium]|nr:hypothetical protein [Frankiales bacterium]